jgi:hypothetical protein
VKIGQIVVQLKTAVALALLTVKKKQFLKSRKSGYQKKIFYLLL